MRGLLIGKKCNKNQHNLLKIPPNHVVCDYNSQKIALIKSHHNLCAFDLITCANGGEYEWQLEIYLTCFTIYLTILIQLDEKSNSTSWEKPIKCEKI